MPRCYAPRNDVDTPLLAARLSILNFLMEFFVRLFRNTVLPSDWKNRMPVAGFTKKPFIYPEVTEVAFELAKAVCV